MNLLRSVAMAFSMFSSIPVPQVEWKQENMRYMLCALPLVGVVIGAALVLWALLARWLGLGQLLYSVGLVILPALISGGIHLDGFCDTVDALSSHAEPEKKRKILKDPNAGAFAVIYLGVYLLALLGLDSELPQEPMAALHLGLIYTLSRSAGALAGTVFPGSTGTGLLAQFRDGAAKKAAVIDLCWCLLCAGALIALSPVGGTAAAVAVLLVLLGVRRMSQREFGGMSGDLAGYLMTIGELLMVFAYVFAEKVVSI